MTIQFNCPKCKSLIAFADKHAGQAARCMTCGEHLIIPAKNGEAPQTVKPKVEPAMPLPGFYHAVFVDSWKIFFEKDNLTALVFVAAAVCFKFFSSGACCLAYVAFFATWGCLFGFYLKIIYETALVGDKLPEIEVGTSVTFLWYIIKPIFIFVFAAFIVLLPYIIVLAIYKDKGVSSENIWQTGKALNLVLRFLFIAGLFLFPMAILTAAVIEDLPELFRLDRLIVPVFRAFIPYIIVVALLAAACFIENHARQYSAGESTLHIACSLAVNLAEQAVAIIAMRSIGLFYRHYGCYFAY
jgi:ribosomal protein S27E